MADPSSLYDLELQSQQEALVERKEMLKAKAILAAKQLGIYAPPGAQETDPGWTSGVNGARMLGSTPKTGFLQAAAPMAATLLNNLDQSAFKDDVSDYRRREQADARAHMAQRPPDDAPAAQKVAWAQQGQRIPSLAPLMNKYAEDQMIAEPDRVAARKDKAAEAALARQAKAEDAQRQREFLATQNDANRSLRETIAAAMGARASGEKASDYSIVQNPADGSVYRVGKKPGAPAERVEGVTGTTGADVRKGREDARQAVENAEKALDLLDQMKPLIPKATSSGFGAVRDVVLGKAGISTQAGDAAGELDQMGKKIVSYIDRKGLGPQFSDSDLKFLRDTSGGLGDPNIPESRKIAVYERVRKQFEDQARGVILDTKGSKPVPGSATLRQPSAGPKVGDVEDGYRYKGGPKGNPSSWEPVK